MQTANRSGFCLGLTMDSNDNVTGAIPRSGTLGSPKKTWKDFSPPNSIRVDTSNMADSGNDNSRRSVIGMILQKHTGTEIVTTNQDVDSSGDSGSISLENKLQLTEGPVIRMGTGVLNARRDLRVRPHCLSSKAGNQSQVLATWKDVSPPKEKINKMEVSEVKSKDGEEALNEYKNRSPIRTNPFHEGHCVSRGSDVNVHCAKRINIDVSNLSDEKPMSIDSSTATGSDTTITTWRDVSPTKGLTNGKKKRPESGYFSNDVQSEGGQESREGIDTSLSDSECGRRGQYISASLPSEDGCFGNDYFYEDEFSVQFDTNLRDIHAGEQNAAEEGIIMPHDLNGSYTKFGVLRDSMLQTEMYLGPYESELSGSRTSMEISSSEREMMCSSDMLNFSNDPLFTPTPPPTDHPPQNLSVDSLSHQGCAVEMGNSHSSNEANLVVDCCIRKDAYYLSFNASQEPRSTSESEISSQTSSHDGQQGGSNSISSNAEDAEDECSNSFQFQNDDEKEKKPENVAQPPPVPYRPIRNMLLSRYPGRICLEALQEYLLDRSGSTKSPGSSRHSCSSHCKLSPLCGTLLSSGDLFTSEGGLRRSRLRRSSNLTTWKQITNLRKLGKEENLHERSRSMPDLTAEDVKVVRREGPSRTVESMTDSFHKKRHSAYLLELYQQMLNSSNPPSPNTLSRIDQILFPDCFTQGDTAVKQEYKNNDGMSCPSCGGRGKTFHLDLVKDTQCGKSYTSVDTRISPQTLILWQGTKNFASQFPPKTSDLGIQTSLGEDGPLLSNRSMQTSPSSPGTELLHMLNELQSKEITEEPKPAEHSKTASMPRAKSANECREGCVGHLKSQMRRTTSLSPSRIGLNAFYTHQSLPDLSFLSLSTRHFTKSKDSSSSNMSLFDPIQIPIILTPIIDDGSGSSHLQTRSGSSGNCSCSKGHAQSSPARKRKPNSCRKSPDLVSSSSSYSLSSSSGIDPGYNEPRSCLGLAPELEHLLFLPPHMESAYNLLGLAETISKSKSQDQNADLKEDDKQLDKENKAPSSPTSNFSPKLERYANEAHPCLQTTGRSGRLVHKLGVGSSNTLEVNDRLDSLKEEKTPSPEPSYCHYQSRDYTDQRCFGWELGSEGESSQEMDEEKLQIYQQWIHDRKPPLKSCLRKRCDRDQKARSLSLDAQDEPPEKPPRRPNRHSIACDGMFPVLINEEEFENANIGPIPKCSPVHAERLASLPDQDKVVLRKKKPKLVSQDSVSSSSLDESNRAKRVSFASEVSFHSPNYTPQSSPRRQPALGDVTTADMDEELLTLIVCSREKGSPRDVPSNDVPLTSATAEVTQELSPLNNKSNILRGVIEAAESLVRHFAQARDPFDKVRLGNAVETPAVGALVVTSLCPAIERVVKDGMKSYLTGVHIFGKIHLSPWRMSETSAEVGPYTRAINELVKQLKLHPNLASHRQKFYAFLTGLLNLRLLDFWMGYISSKENITSRFYDEDSILCLSHTILEQKYKDVLLALQPLAVLPFQIDYEIIAGFSLADSVLMGESDISVGSPRKGSELSSSPKVVVARMKTRTGPAPDRSSWAGSTERQDTYGRSEKVDFSTTWDWIKTTTLPKARSLMSDIGLTPSPSSSVVSMASVAGSVNSVKTSRLSQDLANVGIVSSRQNMSNSASSPSLLMTEKTFVRQESSSLPKEITLSSLPAVVIDHGSKGEISARQKAEDILRRKGEGSPQRWIENSPQKEFPVKTTVAQKQEIIQGGIAIPGQRPGSSSQRRAEISPQRTPESSPSRCSSGSPQRGPVINPGSPKSVVVVRQNDHVELISRHSSKIVLDDFPDSHDNEKDGDDRISRKITPTSSVQSPLNSVCNLAQRWVPKKEEKVYREGKTDYAFDGLPSSHPVEHPNMAATPENKILFANSSPSEQLVSPQKQTPTISSTPARSSGGRWSGLRKLSPKGSFNIISFFDRLLLPSDKNAASSALTTNESSSSFKGAVSEDANLQMSSNNSNAQGAPPVTAQPGHSIAQSVNVQARSGSQNQPKESSVTTTDLKNSSVQSKQSCPKEIPLAQKTVPTGTAIRSNGHQVQTLDYVQETDSVFSEGMNVDINANSPDFSERNQTIFSDSTPPVHSHIRTRDVTKGMRSGSSDQSERGLKSQANGPIRLPDFKYVQTLTSCDPDNQDCLSYDSGDCLEVLAQLNDEWLFCANGRLEGQVRLDAVCPLSDSAVFRKLHENFYQ